MATATQELAPTLMRYDVEAWVRPGFADTVREAIERSLAEQREVEDFGVEIRREE